MKGMQKVRVKTLQLDLVPFQKGLKEVELPS